MPLSTAAKNGMLNWLAGVAGYASAHTADPGDTGAFEVSGGTYTRKAITWNAAAAGSLDNNANPALDIPAGTTVTHIGFWSALTAGTYYGSLDVADEAFTNAGTYTVSDADVALP